MPTPAVKCEPGRAFLRVRHKHVPVTRPQLCICLDWLPLLVQGVQVDTAHGRHCCESALLQFLPPSHQQNRSLEFPNVCESVNLCYDPPPPLLHFPGNPGGDKGIWWKQRSIVCAPPFPLSTRRLGAETPAVTGPVSRCTPVLEEAVMSATPTPTPFPPTHPRGGLGRPMPEDRAPSVCTGNANPDAGWGRCHGLPGAHRAPVPGPPPKQQTSRVLGGGHSNLGAA